MFLRKSGLMAECAPGDLGGSAQHLLFKLSQQVIRHIESTIFW